MSAAAPPPMIGDLYSPEQAVPAIVRHVQSDGWPHYLVPDELTGLAHVLARVVFPRSPYRYGQCTAVYGEGHTPAVTCTVTRPAYGDGKGSAVLLQLTGCRYVRATWNSPVARGFQPCAIWEDGSVRAVVRGVAL